MENNQDSISEWIIKIVCYTMIPLIMMVISVLLCTNVLIGRIETDINNISGFFNVFFTFSFPMFVSLFVIPTIFERKVMKSSWKSLGLCFSKNKVSIYLCLLFSFLTVLSLIKFYSITDISDKTTIVISFIVVAFTEEFLVRGIILRELMERLDILPAIILNGLIFSFVYHSGSDTLGNLIIRFPLGMLLALISIKAENIYPCVLLHFCFNIFVNSF